MHSFLQVCLTEIQWQKCKHVSRQHSSFQPSYSVRPLTYIYLNFQFFLGWSDMQCILTNWWNSSLHCYFSRECSFWQNAVENIVKESPFSFKLSLQTCSAKCHGSCKVFCSLCHKKTPVVLKHSHNVKITSPLTQYKFI